MNTVTVQQVMKGSHQELDEEKIYVVSDGDVVLYVGRTRARLDDRLQRHVHDGSPLGRLIGSNLPSSLGWQVDILAAGDCERVISRREQAMIERLHPCLNLVHNSRPMPLPERYLGVELDLANAPCDHLGLSVEL